MILRRDAPSVCDSNNPFWVVRTDSGIINGHSDFYSKRYFAEFVLSMLHNEGDVTAPASQVERPPN